MPYISKSERIYFDKFLKQIDKIVTKGQLEYCIYFLMLKYMKTRDERFTELHDAVYAAYHCGHEFQRHRLDKREDKAKEENGDVIVE